MRSLLAVPLFGACTYATNIKVTATSDNKFDPSTIHASKGDVINFYFDPKNHSVVSGDYQYPCSPLQLGSGFYSGFIPSDDGLADKIFQVTINDTEPMAFYSSQGGECAGGMVGLINPNSTMNVTDYTHRAASLSKGVTPGTSMYGGMLADRDDSDDGDSSSSSSDSADKKDGDDSAAGVSGASATVALLAAAIAVLSI